MAGISPDLFMDAALAYQHTAAIKAAVELDLFSAIARGDTTAEKLAGATGASVRGVRILCDYLTVRSHLENQMLGSTPRGQAYTAREVEEMGRAAGFGRATVTPLPPAPQSLILFKPA